METCIYCLQLQLMSVTTYESGNAVEQFKSETIPNTVLTAPVKYLEVVDNPDGSFEDVNPTMAAGITNIKTKLDSLIPKAFNEYSDDGYDAKTLFKLRTLINLDTNSYLDVQSTLSDKALQIQDEEVFKDDCTTLRTNYDNWEYENIGQYDILNAEIDEGYNNREDYEIDLMNSFKQFEPDSKYSLKAFTNYVKTVSYDLDAEYIDLGIKEKDIVFDNGNEANIIDLTTRKKYNVNLGAGQTFGGTKAGTDIDGRELLNIGIGSSAVFASGKARPLPNTSGVKLLYNSFKIPAIDSTSTGYAKVSIQDGGTKIEVYDNDGNISTYTDDDNGLLYHKLRKSGKRLLVDVNSKEIYAYNPPRGSSFTSNTYYPCYRAKELCYARKSGSGTYAYLLDINRHRDSGTTIYFTLDDTGITTYDDETDGFEVWSKTAISPDSTILLIKVNTELHQVKIADLPALDDEKVYKLTFDNNRNISISTVSSMRYFVFLDDANLDKVLTVGGIASGRLDVRLDASISNTALFTPLADTTIDNVNGTSITSVDVKADKTYYAYIDADGNISISEFILLPWVDVMVTDVSNSYVVNLQSFKNGNSYINDLGDVGHLTSINSKPITLDNTLADTPENYFQCPTVLPLEIVPSWYNPLQHTLTDSTGSKIIIKNGKLFRNNKY